MKKQQKQRPEVEGFGQFIGTFGNTVAVKTTVLGNKKGPVRMVSIEEGRAALGGYHPPLRWGGRGRFIPRTVCTQASERNTEMSTQESPNSQSPEVEGFGQFIGTFGNTVAVKKPTGVGGQRGIYMVSIEEGRASLNGYHPPLR